MKSLQRPAWTRSSVGLLSDKDGALTAPQQLHCCSIWWIFSSTFHKKIEFLPEKIPLVLVFLDSLANLEHPVYPENMSPQIKACLDLLRALASIKRELKRFTFSPAGPMGPDSPLGPDRPFGPSGPSSPRDPSSPDSPCWHQPQIMNHCRPNDTGTKNEFSQV